MIPLIIYYCRRRKISWRYRICMISMLPTLSLSLDITKDDRKIRLCRQHDGRETPSFTRGIRNMFSFHWHFWIEGISFDWTVTRSLDQTKINITDIMKNTMKDIRIVPGDMLRIYGLNEVEFMNKEVEIFGNVKNPGKYPAQPWYDCYRSYYARRRIYWGCPRWTQRGEVARITRSENLKDSLITVTFTDLPDLFDTSKSNHAILLSDAGKFSLIDKVSFVLIRITPCSNWFLSLVRCDFPENMRYGHQTSLRIWWCMRACYRKMVILVAANWSATETAEVILKRRCWPTAEESLIRSCIQATPFIFRSIRILSAWPVEVNNPGHYRLPRMRIEIFISILRAGSQIAPTLLSSHTPKDTLWRANSLGSLLTVLKFRMDQQFTLQK